MVRMYTDYRTPCTIPSSLLGFAVIADASGVISVPSSSSSSSPSSSSLSVMSASGAGAGGGGCGESAEDATTAAAEAVDDDPGCCGSSSSKASSSRESPHSGIFSNRRCSDEGVPPPTTTTAGGPPSLSEGGGPLDRSTPPPERDLLLHGGGPPVTLDHRRNSLELGCGSRELADGIGHLSQAGVAGGGGGGAADVPAHLRRASIPCMSVSAARGLARGSVAAAHLAHRPSVPLDYESLKVKLEELTGTVTDGKRAKETTGGDRSRRTSLVSLTHPPPAASGSSSAMTPHPEVGRLTPTLTSSTTVAGEGTAAGSHASMRNNGFIGAASYAVAEADEETEYCLQPTCALQTQEPIDAIISQNAKTSQNPTEDSSSSSSSTSSLSSLSLSSSSWDKFRLQYIIEHVLQYDVRLQEILKRHELEMAAIQLKHRFQWMELEKLLTQRLGDQWRKFITIPALSVPPEGVSTSPWRYPAPVEGLDKTLAQAARDEPPGSSICVQNPFDPLQTIKEGQADEDQLDSNAIRIYQQQATATTMQNALQQNGRPVGDVAKSSAITDHAGRRCSTTDACVDTPQRPRAISLSNVFLVGDKATTTGDKAESRICQNIASSLARRQSSVAIMNPNSSRLHRHTTSKEVAPSTRPADTSIPTRPDSSASTRSDPSAASIRPDSSASSSRPSTPQGDYRQLLLLAQMLQNQTYNSRMAQPFLPNFLPTFPAVPFQTTNFAAAYGCDPASMMALNGGILPMEMMGSENGIELNGFRQTQAPHVEVQPPWTNGHQLSASKNCSLQATGEETSRGLPVGYAQPMNGYPGLPHEVPGIGHTGQTLQGYPLFPGLLPSHLAPCQLPSMAQNPWLLRTGGTMGVDCPMSFVTPSSSSLGFPYTMVASNPAFYSLVKDYNSEHM